MPDKRLFSDGAVSGADELPMARLVIEQPRLSDEALYKCDVTYVKGKCPSISLVRVQMMALPNKAQIVQVVPSGAGAATTTNQLDDGQLIGPLNEHEQLRLICRVSGGRPQPRTIIWRKIDPSGRRINLQHEQSRPSRQQAGAGEQLVEVHLNHTLTSADLGAKFECHVEHEALDEPLRPIPSKQASPLQPDSMLDLHPSKPVSSGGDEEDHNNGKQSLDAHVFLDLNVGVASLDLFMSRVNKRNSSEPLKEGDLVELECVAFNSKPPANISWFNGAEPIEQLIDSSMPSSSTPNNLPTFGSGGAGGSGGRSQRQRRLLQRNQVNRNLDGLTYNTHSFLSIKLSRHEHRAQISCQATNQNPAAAAAADGRAAASGPMLRPLSKSLELQVQHTPIVLMEPAGGITVNEQQTGSGENNAIAPPPPVSIYCIYSANPSELTQPNSTRWFKDGLQLQLNNGNAATAHLSESLTATGYPVLNINQVSRRDAGRYDCQLSNTVGTSERLPLSEAVRLEVNFRPSVKLRLFKPNHSTMLSHHQAPPFQLDDLTEIDPNEELILAGQTYVLVCDILEARPNKIEKFHWLRRASAGNQQQQHQHYQQQPYQLIGVSEASQFVLSSLAANFSPASYACAASNALGPSDNSNQVELQLSYSPGPSVVRPVRDAALRKQLLQTGQVTRNPISTEQSDSLIDPLWLGAPLAAGQKILLECFTQDPGQPRANSWLWFKNGQPIDSKSLIQSYNNNNPSITTTTTNNNNIAKDLILDDNPISELDLSAQAQRRNHQHITSRSSKNELGPFIAHENEDTDRSTISGSNSDSSDGTGGGESEKMKLLGSGRYLFIPSIQLVHKGNYSCVAMNRFGSGPQQSSASTSSSSSAPSSRLERDSYNLIVALAPSFVQALPPRTYWPEVLSPQAGTAANPSVAIAAAAVLPSGGDGQSTIMELVCHVQCDPMCNIEWLRNGQPIDNMKGKWTNGQELDAEGSNYVSHQIRQSILDENLEANLFKSIESKLILRVQHMGDPTSMFARERVLARRSYLNGSNYTCQSTPNSMGPAVRSTSKFVVQYSPENVLINAPSDKLSFVEGSNGPRLSCEASGEPQVQYRWLLVRSSGTDLATSKYNNQVKRSSPLASTSSIGGELEQDHAINQAARGANYVPTASGQSSEEENLIDLTSSTSDQRGVTISTLDLSQLSLDRKQSGHYICEASNKLGQSRQSVYVNVLYKPTCSGLHLHSLDMLMAPPNANDIRQTPDTRVKPLRATSNDEYTLVRENSDDFVNLRKTLVISPLLNGHLTGNTHYGQFESGELSLRGSIFQSILDDKRHHSNGVGKDKNALLHMEDTDMSGSENNALPTHDDLKSRPNQDQDSATKSKSGDAWNRFNVLLLKFLNTYVKQVKNYQDSLIVEPSRRDTPRDKRQNSRGSSWPADRLARGDLEPRDLPPDQNRPDSATKNLLTFACMAQDGNPMGNLSFDWSFGSVSLPETPADFIDIESRQANGSDDVGASHGPLASSKPQLIYVNPNRTVSVMLVRRLDTHSSLSPFQMSLLTLDVMIDQQLPSVMETLDSDRKITKRNAESVHNGRYPPQAKAPVIRSRPHNGNNARVNQNHEQQQQQQQQQQQNSNIQFANEFEARPTFSSSGYQIDLDEYNWQEKLGSLLNCRVSNQIGTSDVCHVRVNLAERLKSLSSSESEFAKWRMPSLAQKSLLIVSILVGCALIVFSASALLIGPYLRGLGYKSRETVHESGENNTGQSTSSQKSSVLGLLTNGDSSLQGSSDEDSNGRSNHTDDNGHHTDSLQPLDLGGSSLSGIVSSCGYQTTTSHHNHYQPGQMMHGSDNFTANYDKPRRLRGYPGTYQNGAFNEQTPDRVSASSTSHYLESLALTSEKIRQRRGLPESVDSTTNKIGNPRPSAGSKLLASLKLKSLAKFKVDRISDQASLASHLADLKSYHARSVSGSGTNTTGVSNHCLDSDMSLSLTPPNASSSNAKYFGAPAFRHSYTNARRAANYPNSEQLNRTGPLSTAQDRSVSQRYVESQAGNSIMPTYSNLNSYDSYNAMDEFIRRKELESSIELARSGSARYQQDKYRGHNNIALMQQPTNHSDLNNLYSPQMVRQQPYYLPNQQQSMTLQRASRVPDQRPPVAARPPRRLIEQDLASMQQYQMPVNNRYSMPASAQIPMINSNLAPINTIDSHLDNFASTLAAGQYPNTGRFAPPVGSNEMRQLTQNIYGNSNQQDHRSTEHIYDVNAYATPEQTPQRGGGQINSSNAQSDVSVPRSRVGQLIQTFNSPPD